MSNSRSDRYARPAWGEIDLEALAHNVRSARRLLRSTDRLYAVCKNDAYGCGARECAETMIAAGADAFAVSDPKDAQRLRDAGATVPILLYASTCPDMADAVSELNLISTVHDFDSLAALSKVKRAVDVHVEVDCGYGRLGFTPEEWTVAFARLSVAKNIRVVGMYTHLTNVEEPSAVGSQKKLFERATAIASGAGFRNIETMAASSRVLLGYPELKLNAVNPGRMLYGMLESPWRDKIDLQPVIRCIKSRVLQVKTIPAGFEFDDPRHRAAPGRLRTAVISFGFKDGLPRNCQGGFVLIRGKRARIIGVPATEHTIVDVTDIADASPGDEVVIVGSQDGNMIDSSEAALTYQMSLIEFLPRLALSTERRYVGGSE